MIGDIPFMSCLHVILIWEIGKWIGRWLYDNTMGKK